MSVYAIGDIHGMYHKLTTLLEKLKLKPEDKLIFLGDYIDRGPDSKKVVNIVINLCKHYNAVALMGNHEQMCVKYYNDIGNNIWIMNGGYQTLKSYKYKIPEDHINFFNNLPLYHENDDYYFVHAGFLPIVSPLDSHQDDCLWIRYDFINSYYDWGKKIIFGHTPFKEPLFMKNKIGIDTGACFGGKLTALKLPEETIISI